MLWVWDGTSVENEIILFMQIRKGKSKGSFPERESKVRF